jgi:hypothetical protein
MPLLPLLLLPPPLPILLLLLLLLLLACMRCALWPPALLPLRQLSSTGHL